MPKILVIEDDARVANTLQRGLEETGYTVSVAYDADMGMRLVNSGDFDLIISDVVLPGPNGFEFCKKVRETDPNVPVIMLTALGSTDDKLEGFDAGADDYMTKPFDLREIDARIRALLRRKDKSQIEPEPETLEYAGVKLDLRSHKAERDGAPVKLTPKEFNLLAYMLRNPGRVLPRSEIAGNVWDTHFDTGTNFIDVYINYLRKKIDREHDVKLIHTVPGVGFILSDSYDDKV